MPTYHTRCCSCGRVVGPAYAKDERTSSPCDQCKQAGKAATPPGAAGVQAAGKDTGNQLKSLNATGKATLSEMKTLNDTATKQLEVQNRIAAMNAELVTLNQKQVQLQTAQLDVMQQQKALAEQQLVVQRASAIQLQLQTEMMQLNELRMRRQREFKTAAYAIKRETERVAALSDVLVRALWLNELDAQVKAASLTPMSVEELVDKEYVGAVLQALESEMRRALDTLDDQGRTDMNWLLSYSNYGDGSSLQRRLADARAEIQRAQGIREPTSQKAGWFSSAGPPGLRKPIQWVGTALALWFAFLGAVGALAALLNGEFVSAVRIGVLLLPAGVLLMYWYRFYKNRPETVDTAALAAWEGRAATLDTAEKRLAALEAEHSQDQNRRIEVRDRLSGLVTKHPQLIDLGYEASVS